MTFCVIVNYINTESLKLLSKRQSLDCSKLKAFAKDKIKVHVDLI